MERVQEPTPRFFQRIRNIALALTGISGALLTAPVALPAVLVTIAGYAATAGAIASVISQTAIAHDE